MFKMLHKFSFIQQRDNVFKLTQKFLIRVIIVRISKMLIQIENELSDFISVKCIYVPVKNLNPMSGMKPAKNTRGRQTKSFTIFLG